MTFAELMIMFVEHCRKQGITTLPDFSWEGWHHVLWRIKQEHPRFAGIIGEFDKESYYIPISINLKNATPELLEFYKSNIENEIVLAKAPSYNYSGANVLRIYQEFCITMWNYLFH